MGLIRGTKICNWLGRFVGVVSLASLVACGEELEQIHPVNKISLPVPEKPLVEYNIERGNHASDANPFASFNASSLRFVAVFDQSAVYANQIPANQSDVNKLYGFSDCSTFHHENSARFGWNWQNNALRIYAYVYRNKQRVIQEITTVKLLQENEYRIDKQEGTYVFTVNGENRTVVEAGCSGQPKGYGLYPYFGGDETAPHRIVIRMKDLPNQ